MPNYSEAVTPYFINLSGVSGRSSGLSGLSRRRSSAPKEDQYERKQIDTLYKDILPGDTEAIVSMNIYNYNRPDFDYHRESKKLLDASVKGWTSAEDDDGRNAALTSYLDKASKMKAYAITYERNISQAKINKVQYDKNQEKVLNTEAGNMPIVNSYGQVQVKSTDDNDNINVEWINPSDVKGDKHSLVTVNDANSNEINNYSIVGGSQIGSKSFNQGIAVNALDDNLDEIFKNLGSDTNDQTFITNYKQYMDGDVRGIVKQQKTKNSDRQLEILTNGLVDKMSPEAKMAMSRDYSLYRSKFGEDSKRDPDTLPEWMAAKLLVRTADLDRSTTFDMTDIKESLNSKGGSGGSRGELGIAEIIQSSSFYKKQGAIIPLMAYDEVSGDVINLDAGSVEPIGIEQAGVTEWLNNKFNVPQTSRDAEGDRRELESYPKAGKKFAEGVRTKDGNILGFDDIPDARLIGFKGVTKFTGFELDGRGKYGYNPILKRDENGNEMYKPGDTELKPLLKQQNYGIATIRIPSSQLAESDQKWFVNEGGGVIRESTIAGEAGRFNYVKEGNYIFDEKTGERLQMRVTDDKGEEITQGFTFARNQFVEMDVYFPLEDNLFYGNKDSDKDSNYYIDLNKRKTRDLLNQRNQRITDDKSLLINYTDDDEDDGIGGSVMTKSQIKSAFAAE